MNAVIALYESYGIPYLDYWTRLKEQISLGHHLNEYYEDGDPVHPLEAGHNLAFNLLRPYLPTGGATAPDTLPDRLYDNGDMENAPVHVVGTAYDSIDGTWSTDDTQISSSDVNATVTYSATCKTWGLWRNDGLQNYVQVSIDGGLFVDIPTTVPGKAGVAISGDRALHTITIRPKSGTVVIDEFWTI
jgi:hypothetical protein